MHFVPDVVGPNGKAGFLQSITTRLKPGASFFLVLSATSTSLSRSFRAQPLLFSASQVDVCGDRKSPEYSALTNVWCEYLQVKGGSKDFAEQMREVVMSSPMLHPVTEQRMNELLTAAGFADVQRVYTGFHFVGLRARFQGASSTPTASATAPATAPATGPATAPATSSPTSS
jgi:hypothetical protein